MTRTLWLVVAMLAGAAVGRTADDDAAKAKAVVERAVKAIGADKDGPDTHQTWSDKGKFTALGMAIDYSGKWWFSGPDKYRFEIKLNLGGTDMEIVSVVNGDKSWESAMGQTREVTGEKLEYVKNQVYAYRVYSLTPLLSDKAFVLKPAAGEKVDGAETDGVEVTSKGRPAIQLYFDKKTGMLAKASGTVKNEFDDWKDVKEEVYFAGWKPLDGGKRQVSTKMKVVRGGETMIEAEEFDQKYHDKLDAKLFEALK
jgi:outer membrane lipoprotein-sorting protein